MSVLNLNEQTAIRNQYGLTPSDYAKIANAQPDGTTVSPEEAAFCKTRGVDPATYAAALSVVKLTPAEEIVFRSGASRTAPTLEDGRRTKAMQVATRISAAENLRRADELREQRRREQVARTIPWPGSIDDLARRGGSR
jgi:hypothetical protein